MTLLIYVTGTTVIGGLTVTVLVLVMTRGDLVWQRDEALKSYRKTLDDLERAEQERNTAVREMSRVLGDKDATVRLPAWGEFLDPQAAHDRAVTEQMEQQFRDGAS